MCWCVRVQSHSSNGKDCRTSELLIRLGSTRGEFNDAGSNGFANWDNIDLVSAFGLMI